MKVLVYSTKDYEKTAFSRVESHHHLVFTQESLSLSTVDKAAGYDVVCCFVTDCLQKDVIHKLASHGVKLIALRSVGFDHVDLDAAQVAGITIVRVPKYSPESIAEFAVSLILILSRKIFKSVTQSLDNNFSLDGLIGFTLHKKTVGIVGTGNIGTAFVKIMHGFGCRLLAFDPEPNDTCKKLNVNYVSFETLLQESDIISLHCPLNSNTHHLMNEKAYAQVKKDAILINTARGALCDTAALIKALESGKLGYAGLDVYEHEQKLFFRDHTGEIIDDELFLKLRSLDNVIITPHQAFFTHEAIENIVKITLNNINTFANSI